MHACPRESESILLDEVLFLTTYIREIFVITRAVDMMIEFSLSLYLPRYTYSGPHLVSFPPPETMLPELRNIRYRILS